ncbi:MAG: site-2 protease family protein [Planctomycetota bacterium]
MLRNLFSPRLMGHLFGIPIRVVPAVFVLVGLALLASGGNGKANPVAVLILLALLAVALLGHELAHALVAKRLGLRVIDITIWPLGGMARMEGLATSPQHEALVAAAGPAANIGFGLILLLVPGPIAADAAWINLVLGLGNLLPAFPLDGGRILRAWLARRSPLVDATRAANRLAQALGILALMFCFYHEALLIGIILGIYLWWSGQMEYIQVVLREGRHPSLTTSEVWRRACYPWFSRGGPEPSADPTQEDLESFRGSLDEFFHDRDSK